MCGRFTQAYSWSEVVEFLRVIAPAARNLRPRYNVSPTTTVEVVRVVDGVRELVPMRWGLVPSWWKKPLKDLPSTINARVETVAEKPMFRGAYKARRCIIPASGFFEWTGPKEDRQPHYFSAADGSPILAFAGLWEWWKSPEGEEILSCTILVTEATDFMGIYHDRMPIILQEPDISLWLDGSLGAGPATVAAGVALQEWTVSKLVNKAGAGDDDPETVARLA